MYREANNPIPVYSGYTPSSFNNVLKIHTVYTVVMTLNLNILMLQMCITVAKMYLEILIVDWQYSQRVESNVMKKGNFQRCGMHDNKDKNILASPRLISHA